MALDFPNSPTNGQTYSSGDFTWVYQTPPGAWICQGGGGVGGGGIGAVVEDTAPRLGGNLDLNGHVILAATGSITGLTKADVGLSNVDNTSDLNKPISTATQTALNTKATAVHTHAQTDVSNLVPDLALKAPLASPSFTGAPTAPTPTAGDNTTRIATTAYVTANTGNVIGPVSSTTGAVATYSGTTGKLIANSGMVPGAVSGIATLGSDTKLTAAQDRVLSVATRQGDVVLSKGDVGLSNVDDTSDANKPISSATQVALNAKSAVGHTHTTADVGGLDLALASVIPAGSIFDYAGNTAPTGYFLCNGQAISRGTYAALFAVIGTGYGTGDGTTTFNVPDLRGRTTVGVGQGSGLSNRTLGSAFGVETHVLSWGQMPAHSHQYTECYDPGGNVNIESGDNFRNHLFRANWSTSQGNNEAHPNVQPSFALNKIIKT